MVFDLQTLPYWSNELNAQPGTVPVIGDLSLTDALDRGWLRSEVHQVDGSSVADTILGPGLAMNIKIFN